MKTEKELKKFLKDCEKVCDFGFSKGPCPMNSDGRKGCCAECSTPSAIEWVLETEKNDSKNGQQRLIDIL